MYYLLIGSWELFWSGLKNLPSFMSGLSWRMRIRVIAWFVVLILVLKFFFGTFLIDHFMMTIIGYSLTLFVYRPGGFLERKAKKAHRFANEPAGNAYWESKIFWEKFFLVSFSLSILSLWIGGLLPYLHLVPPTAVYAGIFPESVVGANGSEFMWNGFIRAIGLEAVPPKFFPTYKLFWFNVYALYYWLSFIPVLGYVVFRAQRTAFMAISGKHPKLRRQFLGVVALALIWFIIDIAMSQFLVWIYS
jgi:hypothetical protein